MQLTSICRHCHHYCNPYTLQLWDSLHSQPSPNEKTRHFT